MGMLLIGNLSNIAISAHTDGFYRCCSRNEMCKVNLVSITKPSVNSHWFHTTLALLYMADESLRI